MDQYSYETNKQLLQDLMEQVNISNLEELSRVAKVARLQLIRIQRGLILNVSAGAISRIAKALKISIENLIDTFIEPSPLNIDPQKVDTQDALTICKQEYKKLQQEMIQQQSFLETEFQTASLETIESWLLQWPTAVAAVNKNPHLPAARLLTLVEPLNELLGQWDVQQISSVGAKLPFNPQYHQLIQGTAQVGELVKVRYVGYKQEDKLLYKAKVSPVSLEDEE